MARLDLTTPEGKEEYFKDLLKDFENAAIARSWKGAQDPRDYERIEYEYELKKTLLINYTKGMIINAQNNPT